MPVFSVASMIAVGATVRKSCRVELFSVPGTVPVPLTATESTAAVTLSVVSSVSETVSVGARDYNSDLLSRRVVSRSAVVSNGNRISNRYSFAFGKVLSQAIGNAKVPRD